MAIALGAALTIKTLVVLALIGRSLEAANRERGDDARRLNRRAMWWGLEEVVWFFLVCAVLSL